MWKLAVANVNVIVVIGLLVCYVYLFGVISFKRYLEKDVIIISHEEDSGVTKPGETLSSFIQKFLSIYFRNTGSSHKSTYRQRVEKYC